MASNAAEISIGISRASLTKATRDIEQAIVHATHKPLNLKINTGSQPLGRISKDLSEFNKSLAASNARVLAFGASAGIIYQFQRAMRGLVDSTIKVEKSLTAINAIIGTSQTRIKQFGGQLFDIARATSSSFEQVSEAALEFARQGLTIEETAKRTRDAMILVNQGGLKAADAVKTLTAVVNGFSKAGVSTYEILNKMVSVDQAFAVSTQDLAQGLSRAGATAANAKVSLDELFAIITSLQQTTARGGAIIGNGLKSIFTRLQRTEVLDQLRQLGVTIEDTGKKTLPATQILLNLADTYKGMSDSTRSFVAEQVAGVYQINLFQAAMEGLNKEFSIYAKALIQSKNASNEAILRQQELNKTVSARYAQTLTNMQRASAGVGEIVIKPTIDKTLDYANTLFDSINNQLEGKGIGGELGGKIAKGILKGIGDALAGPGLILIGATLTRLVAKLAVDSAKALREVMGTNNALREQQMVQDSIYNIMQKQPTLWGRIQSGAMSVAQAESLILKELKMANAEMKQMEAISRRIGGNLVAVGAIGASSKTGSVSLFPKASKKTKSFGHVPPQIEMEEKLGALRAGYAPGKVEKIFLPSVGTAYKNSAEDAVYAAGFAEPFINPPRGTSAALRHTEKSMQRYGINPYALNEGFVPNLAFDFWASDKRKKMFDKSQFVTVYHATDSSNLSSIIKKGLTPSRAGVINKDFRGEFVFLSSTAGMAKQAGQQEKELKQQYLNNPNIYKKSGSNIIIESVVPRDFLDFVSSNPTNEDILSSKTIPPKYFNALISGFGHSTLKPYRRKFKWGKDSQIIPKSGGFIPNLANLQIPRSQIRPLLQTKDFQGITYSKASGESGDYHSAQWRVRRDKLVGADAPAGYDNWTDFDEKTNSLVLHSIKSGEEAAKFRRFKLGGIKQIRSGGNVYDVVNRGFVPNLALKNISFPQNFTGEKAKYLARVSKAAPIKDLDRLLGILGSPRISGVFPDNMAMTMRDIYDRLGFNRIGVNFENSNALYLGKDEARLMALEGILPPNLLAKKPSLGHAAVINPTVAFERQKLPSTLIHETAHHIDLAPSRGGSAFAKDFRGAIASDRKKYLSGRAFNEASGISLHANAAEEDFAEAMVFGLMAKNMNPRYEKVLRARFGRYLPGGMGMVDRTVGDPQSSAVVRALSGYLGHDGHVPNMVSPNFRYALGYGQFRPNPFGIKDIFQKGGLKKFATQLPFRVSASAGAYLASLLPAFKGQKHTLRSAGRYLAGIGGVRNVEHFAKDESSYFSPIDNQNHRVTIDDLVNGTYGRYRGQFESGGNLKNAVGGLTVLRNKYGVVGQDPYNFDNSTLGFSKYSGEAESKMASVSLPFIKNKYIEKFLDKKDVGGYKEIESFFGPLTLTTRRDFSSKKWGYENSSFALDVRDLDFAKYGSPFLTRLKIKNRGHIPNLALPAWLAKKSSGPIAPMVPQIKSDDFAAQLKALGVNVPVGPMTPEQEKLKKLFELGVFDPTTGGTRMRMADGHAPNMALKTFRALKAANRKDPSPLFANPPDRHPDDYDPETLRILNSETGSALDFRQTKRYLDIKYITSLKRGNAREMFEKLYGFASKRGKGISSEALVSQLNRVQQASAAKTKWGAVLAMIPQLRYREGLGKTRGTMNRIVGKSIEARHFSDIDELKSMIESLHVTKPELIRRLRRENIWISDVVTNPTFGGFIPNMFSPLSAAKEREKAALAKVYGGSPQFYSKFMATGYHPTARSSGNPSGQIVYNTLQERNVVDAIGKHAGEDPRFVGLFGGKIPNLAIDQASLNQMEKIFQNNPQLRQMLGGFSTHTYEKMLGRYETLKASPRSALSQKDIQEIKTLEDYFSKLFLTIDKGVKANRGEKLGDSLVYLGKAAEKAKSSVDKQIKTDRERENFIIRSERGRTQGILGSALPSPVATRPEINAAQRVEEMRLASAKAAEDRLFGETYIDPFSGKERLSPLQSYRAGKTSRGKKEDVSFFNRVEAYRKTRSPKDIAEIGEQRFIEGVAQKESQIRQIALDKKLRRRAAWQGAGLGIAFAGQGLIGGLEATIPESNRAGRGITAGLGSALTGLSFGAYINPTFAGVGAILGAVVGIDEAFKRTADETNKFQSELDLVAEKTNKVSVALGGFADAQTMLQDAVKSRDSTLISRATLNISKNLQELGRLGISKDQVEVLRGGSRSKQFDVIQEILEGGNRQTAQASIARTLAEQENLQRRRFLFGFDFNPLGGNFGGKGKNLNVLDEGTFSGKQLRESISAQFVSSKLTAKEFEEKYAKEFDEFNEPSKRALKFLLQSIEETGKSFLNLGETIASQQKTLEDMSKNLSLVIGNMKYKIRADQIIREGRFEAGLGRLEGGINKNVFRDEASIGIDERFARARIEGQFKSEILSSATDNLFDFVNSDLQKIVGTLDDAKAKETIALALTDLSKGANILQITETLSKNLVSGNKEDSEKIQDSIQNGLQKVLGEMQIGEANRQKAIDILESQLDTQMQQLKFQRERTLLGGIEGARNPMAFLETLSRIRDIPAERATFSGGSLGMARGMNLLSRSVTGYESIMGLFGGAEMPDNIRSGLLDQRTEQLAAQSFAALRQMELNPATAGFAQQIRDSGIVSPAKLRAAAETQIGEAFPAKTISENFDKYLTENIDKLLRDGFGPSDQLLKDIRNIESNSLRQLEDFNSNFIGYQTKQLEGEKAGVRKNIILAKEQLGATEFDFNEKLDPLKQKRDVLYKDALKNLGLDEKTIDKETIQVLFDEIKKGNAILKRNSIIGLTGKTLLPGSTLSFNNEKIKSNLEGIDLENVKISLEKLKVLDEDISNQEKLKAEITERANHEIEAMERNVRTLNETIDTLNKKYGEKTKAGPKNQIGLDSRTVALEESGILNDFLKAEKERGDKYNKRRDAEEKEAAETERLTEAFEKLGISSRDFTHNLELTTVLLEKTNALTIAENEKTRSNAKLLSQSFLELSLKVDRVNRENALTDAATLYNQMRQNDLASTGELRGAAGQFRGLLKRGGQNPLTQKETTLYDMISAGVEEKFGTTYQTRWEEITDITLGSLDDIKGGFSEAFRAITEGSDDAGTKVIEAFTNMLARINDRITENAFDNIFRAVFKSALPMSVSDQIPQARARGGKITGGSGVRDDVPAYLMGGEYVIKKSMVEKYGEDFLKGLNEGRVPAFKKGGLFDSEIDARAIGGGYGAFLNISPFGKNIYNKNKMLSGYAIDNLNWEPFAAANSLIDTERQFKAEYERFLQEQTRARRRLVSEAGGSALGLAGLYAGSRLPNTDMGNLGAGVLSLAGVGGGRYLGSMFARGGYVKMAEGGDPFDYTPQKDFTDFPGLTSKYWQKEEQKLIDKYFYMRLAESEKTKKIGVAAQFAAILASAAGAGIAHGPNIKVGIPVNSQNIPVGIPVTGNIANTMAFNPAVQEGQILRSGILNAANIRQKIQYPNLNLRPLPIVETAQISTPNIAAIGGVGYPKYDIVDGVRYVQRGPRTGWETYARGGISKDNIPALLTAGEFVVNRGAVDRYGKSFFDALNHGNIGPRMYNEGGYVTGSFLNKNAGDVVGIGSRGVSSNNVQNNNNVSISVNVSESGKVNTSVEQSGERGNERKARDPYETAKDNAVMAKQIEAIVMSTMAKQSRPGGFMYRKGIR